MVVRPTPHLRLLDEEFVQEAPQLVESYRRLADLFHEVLAEQSLDALFIRIGDALRDLIPHDTLTIYEDDESQQPLSAGVGPDASRKRRGAVCARDEGADGPMRMSLRLDEGITGGPATRREPVMVNQAH